MSLFGGNYMGQCHHMIPNGVSEKDCPVCAYLREPTPSNPVPEVDEKGLVKYPNLAGKYRREVWEQATQRQQAYDKEVVKAERDNLLTMIEVYIGSPEFSIENLSLWIKQLRERKYRVN